MCAVWLCFVGLLKLTLLLVKCVIGSRQAQDDNSEEAIAARRAGEQLMELRLTMLRVASRMGLRPNDVIVQEFINRVDTAERVR